MKVIKGAKRTNKHTHVRSKFEKAGSRKYGQRARRKLRPYSPSLSSAVSREARAFSAASTFRIAGRENLARRDSLDACRADL